MSKQVLINCMVKPERVSEYRMFVKRIFEQLWQEEIQGVKYDVYKMEDNLFIHISRFATEEAKVEFEHLESVMLFNKNLNQLTNEKPVVNEVEEIEDYR